MDDNCKACSDAMRHYIRNKLIDILKEHEGTDIRFYARTAYSILQNDILKLIDILEDEQ